MAEIKLRIATNNTGVTNLFETASYFLRTD